VVAASIIGMLGLLAWSGFTKEPNRTRKRPIPGGLFLGLVIAAVGGVAFLAIHGC
jgi:hypothetical protein